MMARPADQTMVLNFGKFLLVFVLLLSWPIVESQSLLNVTEIRSARALDIMLQDYAYRAFVTPRTGVSFDGSVPKNLTGIRVSALRLRSGSLFKRGFSMYKEFNISRGVIEQPYVERLVLVYQNLGNWSKTYYPLPGYMYLAPMLGLLAYDASDLLAKNLPELDIFASGEPILIDFGKVKLGPDGSTAKCVWVDLDGQVNFTNVVSGNKCFAFRQGHFSIVVNSTTSLVPASPLPKSPVPAVVLNPNHKGGGVDSTVWVIVGSVVGGCLLLVLLALLVLWVRGYKKRKKMHKMERTAERGEPLHMTTIGGMKAPAAMVTRTQPTLETEYAP
uniref:uncharacterized protein LOC122608152 n=1 Tax=Erigeron canadensis TaxID=72917 RepID=UPI001CB8968F|nr:uncharacterized protein LOC122608152 [Erigeron canadensis]